MSTLLELIEIIVDKLLLNSIYMCVFVHVFLKIYDIVINQYHISLLCNRITTLFTDRLFVRIIQLQSQIFFRNIIHYAVLAAYIHCLLANNWKKMQTLFDFANFIVHFFVYLFFITAFGFLKGSADLHGANLFMKYVFSQHRIVNYLQYYTNFLTELNSLQNIPRKTSFVLDKFIITNHWLIIMSYHYIRIVRLEDAKFEIDKISKFTPWEEFKPAFSTEVNNPIIYLKGKSHEFDDAAVFEVRVPCDSYHNLIKSVPTLEVLNPRQIDILQPYEDVFLKHLKSIVQRNMHDTLLHKNDCAICREELKSIAVVVKKACEVSGCGLCRCVYDICVTCFANWALLKNPRPHPISIETISRLKFICPICSQTSCILDIRGANISV